jgi:23S rRNA (adenine2030-N6)-methyltransferase
MAFGCSRRRAESPRGSGKADGGAKLQSYPILNYRHRFHAGNFADVLKHAVLRRVLLALQAKAGGLLYLDTHAGRGAYDLRAAASGASRARRPEWPDGIGRLLERRDLPPALADYVAAVREFSAETARRVATEPAAGGEAPLAVPDALEFYPGSPWLAVAALRAQDRAVLCERQPEEAAALAAELAQRRRVAVRPEDGYAAVRGCLPPPERRALVLLDPPFEAEDEWARLVEALHAGLGRWPAGTFAAWYPLTARSRADAFYREYLRRPKLPPSLCVELLVGDDTAGLKLWGCGLLITNPPWGLAAELAELAQWLGPVLAQGPGARGGAHWIVPET